LFKNDPLLHQAYKDTLDFRNIYEQTSREIGKEKIINWIQKIKLLNMTVFNTVANSLNDHLETILNVFIKRHTNAESFKSKQKKSIKIFPNLL
jgi:hypothetical protein